MIVQQLDDEELLDLITQKNEVALSELYDRYSRLVFSVAFGVVGDRGSAEEITLDIFIQIWEKAHTYRVERAKVYTWLTRMTRNRSIDILRRENVRPLKHSLVWAEVANEPAADDDAPETVAHLAIQKVRVQKAMADLSDDQKDVLALAFFRGYTHSEIARELNLPLGTVKGRIRSGMQKLRALLVEE
ncbi:MAG: sigma-70 family RNA polymerase sigma factor [Anaerolineae bacterium]|nr:MAG: sigma-70 family RNA polymerase sigma factor [Anaerolineae bacterium]